MSTQDTSTTGEWAAAHSPVVVGIDGSANSTSALAWAVAEAARSGADLRLVAVVEDRHLPRFPLRPGRDATVGLLERFAAEVGEDLPDSQVSPEVYDGHAAPTLLDHLGHARLLVIGKRGLSPLPRLIVGSTSLALAGRAKVPVAVVPSEWDAEAHTGEPVIVGLDPYRDSHHLLHMAFRRAQALKVPLVPVHGWEAPGAPVWTDAPVDEWERESHEKFHEELGPWRDRFPDVELREVVSSHHPAVALLDEAERSGQLVMVGRRSAHRSPGFPFGSVTRAVLHYATTPVLVVPTPED